jgi:hypothetical protein
MERYVALYQMRADGTAEITGFRKAELELVKQLLDDEVKRGTLRYWFEE